MTLRLAITAPNETPRWQVKVDPTSSDSYPHYVLFAYVPATFALYSTTSSVSSLRPFPRRVLRSRSPRNVLVSSSSRLSLALASSLPCCRVPAPSSPRFRLVLAWSSPDSRLVLALSFLRPRGVLCLSSPCPFLIFA